jgi:hypothetical protein
MIDAEGKPVKHFGQTYLNHNTLKFSSYLINPFFHGSVMLKSQVLRPNSYHTESSAEDFELWLRLCSKGFKFASLKESLYRYRINPTGYSKSKTAKQNEGHILASKQYVELLLNEKLDTNIMSILNCRPQSKPSINEVFKAIKLFKRIKAAVAPANENELRTFIRRQRLDIFIQSLKSGKNIITKFLLLLFTLLELLHFRSAQYFIQKIWSKRVY